MAGRANLFVIGAMKSGTTSLHGYLDMHPEIAMSEEKEPGFFVKELNLRRGEDWYASLFESETQYRYRGESSTHYTKLPLYVGVPERIFQYEPNARFIYIMRSPFERLISHYWHAVRDIHHGGEVRSLVEAVTEQQEYLAFGDYARQLEPYINRFGRDALLTLTFESLVRDPQKEFDRICDWLGISRYAIGNEYRDPQNAKPKSMVGVAGAGLLNRIQYSSAWDRISPLCPRTVKDWARGLAYREVEESNAAAERDALRRMVSDIQKRHVESLCRLLNRDFPEWDTVDGATTSPGEANGVASEEARCVMRGREPGSQVQPEPAGYPRTLGH